MSHKLYRIHHHSNHESRMFVIFCFIISFILGCSKQEPAPVQDKVLENAKTEVAVEQPEPVKPQPAVKTVFGMTEKEKNDIKTRLDKYQKHFTKQEINNIQNYTNFSKAKEFIDNRLKEIENWHFESPDRSFPRGLCWGTLSNFHEIHSFSDNPNINIFRDRAIAPMIIMFHHPIAATTDKISMQFDDLEPENIKFEKKKKDSVLLHITEEQYQKLSQHKNLKIMTLTSDDQIINTFEYDIKQLGTCIAQMDNVSQELWHYEEKVNTFDGTVVRYCSGVTLDEVTSKLSLKEKEQPVMVIRQKNNKTPEIMLISDGVQWAHIDFFRSKRIRLKFNDEPIMTISFSGSTDSLAKIFLNSEKKLLSKFLSSYSVTIEVPTTGETITYDLLGFQKACTGLELSQYKPTPKRKKK
ncbi:MAG: hypothetical protein J6S69_09180 [Proteobacteria bacterium]|nr:hypothetical protein [Pseudomonadota bacterium]